MASRSPPTRAPAFAWSASGPGKVADGSCLPLEVPGPSMLSRFFASLGRHASPEARTDAQLADIADTACRSLHLMSQKHKPSVQALREGLAQASRHETLAWLVQAFDVMHFSESLLFDTALLLDRYYACIPGEDVHGGAQRKLLAAVCMALKTGTAVDTQMPLRQIVTHLGRDQVPFDEVLAAELAMLRKLRFQVGTPTAHDFLDTLGTRVSAESGVPDSCMVLADFLLQLTLADAQLHYRYPHAVLAASTVALALQAVKAPATAYMALLEDLALHCPESAAPSGVVLQCTAAVHALWIRSVDPHEQCAYARHVCAKFNRVSHHNVSSQVPPAAPPSVLPPAPSPAPSPCSQTPCWAAATPSARTALDDLDEAMRIVRQSLLSSGGTSVTVCAADSCGAEGTPNSVASAARRSSNAICGGGDAEDWQATLALRLSGLAESSRRVRGVLVRFGWSGGRFRRPLDREQLLREIARAAVVHRRLEKGAMVAGTTRGCSVGTPMCAGMAGGATEGSLVAGDARRRVRSASWCGQQARGASVGFRTGGYALTRSP